MSNTSTPSPLPFLLLGLVTGGALLYVSYWVWPQAQRRNPNNRSNRRSSRRQNASSRNTGTSSGQGLRRSNATRRPNTHRQQTNTSRRDDSRQYHSDGSSSEEEPSRRRGYGYDSDDGDTTDHDYTALVDEDGYERLRIDDFGDSKHDGLQLMNLLYAIAEDQAGKEGHIHRGITCNSCRTVPIRGLRYKCANCQDYDLCEGCEAAEVHIKSHVFMKIRIPIPPLANSRNKKLPSFYPGIPQGNTNTPDHLLQELLQKSHFDNVELDAMYSQYLSLSTLDQEGGGITRLTFEQALGPLGLEKNLITDRIFRFFDQDDDGIINFKEMACGLSVLCKGNFDEKIDFAFQGYDLDGDGYISREELHEMFKAYFYLSMELIRDVVKTMENDLINSFEYQPGMPISSTFTAPIPREIGVRTNNSQNDNNNNTNGNGHRTAQERRRNREQTPLAEWSLPVIPSDESSGSSTPASSPSVHGSGVAVEEEFEEPVTGRVADRLGSDEPRESTLPSGWYVADALMNPQDTDDEDTKTGVDDVKEIDDEGTGILAATDGDIEKSQSTGLEMPESPELGRRRDSSDSEESETDTIERRVHSPTPVPSDGDHSLDHPSGSNSFQTSDGLPGTSPAVVRDSLEASSGDEDEGSSSSWSRPRKDQPLPLTTSSPHLAVPSLSNTNFAWERPHHRTGSSGSYLQVSPAAPSLAPALAIGFGLPHGATSTSSSSSSPSSSSSTQNRHISRASRTSDFNDRRRPSLGGPFHSFGPSSSAPTGSYANSSYFSGTFPVMESISQDAIQEMVDKTFSAIKDPSKPGFITLEEFRAYVLTDAGILGWFDALGSIF